MMRVFVIAAAPLSLERDADDYSGAACRVGANLEATPQFLGSFAHTEQATPGVESVRISSIAHGRHAFAIISDLDGDAIRLVTQANFQRAGLCVLINIGQRFLRDAKDSGAHLHAALVAPGIVIQRFLLTLNLQSRGQAADSLELVQLRR